MTPTTSGFVHVGTAATVALIVVTAADLPWWPTFVALAAGGVIGRTFGERRGRDLECSVDPAGGLVLYADRTVLHALVAQLGLTALTLSPLALGTILRELEVSPRLLATLQGAVCVLAGAWLAHDITVARHLRRLEKQFGRLDVQWFHSASVVGPEGLLGRTAVVVTECRPRGKVQVDGELWNAETLDGRSVDAGCTVVVRRLRGLTLVVDEPGRMPKDSARDQNDPPDW